MVLESLEVCALILYTDVDDGPGKVEFALMDQNGPEKV